jgi:hypothetical protein
VDTAVINKDAQLTKEKKKKKKGKRKRKEEGSDYSDNDRAEDSGEYEVEQIVGFRKGQVRH